MALIWWKCLVLVISSSSSVLTASSQLSRGKREYIENSWHFEIMAVTKDSGDTSTSEEEIPVSKTDYEA